MIPTATQRTPAPYRSHALISEPFSAGLRMHHGDLCLAPGWQGFRAEPLRNSGRQIQVSEGVGQGRGSHDTSETEGHLLLALFRRLLDSRLGSGIPAGAGGDAEPEVSLDHGPGTATGAEALRGAGRDRRSARFRYAPTRSLRALRNTLNTGIQPEFQSSRSAGTR